MKFSIKKLFC